MLFIATEIQITDGDISREILVLFIALEIQNIQIADGDISRGILVLFITLFYF